MTPSIPKGRIRTPGRRRGFAPDAGPRNISPGTDQEWEQALSSPHLQAALRDPQIQQALAQSLQGPGMAPQRLQGGGQSIDSILASLPADVTEDQKNQLRNYLNSQSGSQSGPSAKSVATTGGANPFGGGQSSNPNSILPMIQGALGTSGQSNPNSILPMLQGIFNPNANKGGSSTTSTTGSMTGSSTGTQQNQVAPPSWSNALGPMALAGIMGLGSGMGPGPNVGASLVGMGTAGLLNYLLRKGKQVANTSAKDIPGAVPGVTSKPISKPFTPDLGQASLNAQNTPGTPDNWDMPQFQPPPTQTAEDLPSSFLSGSPSPWNPDLAMYDTSAFAEGGEVHPDAAEDRKQTLGILKEKNLLPKKKAFADGGLEEDSALTKAKLNRAVPVRKPLGEVHAHPIPVISTTIVLSKKKPEKKKVGGPIKAKALPPKRGSEPSGPPSPFKKGGHVQVPRGFGAAIRGKRFGGIY